MAEAAATPQALRLHRAFFAVMMFAGSVALGAGFYGTMRVGAFSWLYPAELLFGLSVLVVSWRFLAPAAFPEELAERRRAGETPSEEPDRETPTPDPAVGAEPAPVPSPASVIPRWADPLVGAPVNGAIRPTAHPGVLFGAQARGLEDPPALSRSVARLAAAPSDSAAWEDDVPAPAHSGRTARSAAMATPLRIEPASSDVLAELDRIEAELGNFEPLEPPAGPALGAPAPSIETFSD